jgi:ligand-binding SRPBCC domain-containing protein
MKIFTFAFKVNAPLQKVAEFHRDLRALKLLSPPPMFVQLHQVEPLAEGSKAEFTMWFGPIPLHWLAVHSGVDALHGFTDTQMRGPMQTWRHTHHFESLDEQSTQVNEQVEYEYKSGLAGLFTRILFNPLGLRVLFTYRAWVTRKQVKK